LSRILTTAISETSASISIELTTRVILGQVYNFTMYIDRAFLILGAIGIVLYLYSKSQAKNKKLSERSNHIVSKYQKEIQINQGYSQRIRKLSELVNDLITLTLVQRLAKSNMKRFDLIQGKNYKGGDSLDIWVEESKDKRVVEARQVRDQHSAILRKLDELESLYDEQLQECLRNGLEKDVRSFIEDLMDGYIFTESFYQDVNKSKSLHKDKLDYQKFSTQAKELMRKLDEIIMNFRDRKFGLA
jgi:hypothetical protein